MDKQVIMDIIMEEYSSNKLNFIPKEKALSDELISVKIFSQPIVAVTTAENHGFEDLKQDNIIGEHFDLPTQWLSSARTVISIFFPYTEVIRDSNKADMSYPSKGWLNGRIEGQFFINNFSANIVSALESSGYKSVSPSVDSRYFAIVNFDKRDKKQAISKQYTSNWSERHVAYVCGLGTFSLSKGLITEKGVAGRFTSIITELCLPDDNIGFNSYDENCIMCGKCIKNCPANAISFEHGKIHKLCSDFLDLVRAENEPWYGCGSCQVGVPCEYKNPSRPQR